MSFRGIFNTYNKKKSIIEILLKDINHLFLNTKNFFANGFKKKVILIYPDYPGSSTTIYKISKYLNYNVTNKLSKNPDIIIHWEDETYKTKHKSLEPFLAHKKVINLHSTDISKTYVDQVFNSVFGYSISINPKEYTGPIVKKSNLNAAHDGEIIEGPIQEIDDNFVYQKLIDNKTNTDTVLDIRVPVIDEILDFVYYKYRKHSERFKNTTTQTQLIKTDVAFSKQEIKLLHNFCKKMNLEYGELDVLRNNLDQKIYIVDVNNTPHGPPANTLKADKKYAIKEMAKKFEAFAKN